MCGRNTSSNAARSSLFCTMATDIFCWPETLSEPSTRSISVLGLGSVHRKPVRCAASVVVMLDSPRPFTTCLFDDDLSLHVRMQAAKVVVGAGAGEREGIRILSIERLRPEDLVLVDHVVWDVVVVDPLHGRAHRDRQFRSGEGEVVDGDDIFLLSGDGSERQQCAGERT